MNPLLFPAVVEIGVISYRTLTGQRLIVAKGQNGKFGVQSGSGPKRPPLPSELLAVIIVFSVYSAIAGNGANPQRARIGALLGWGTVLATFLTMFSAPAPKAAPTAVGGK